MLIVKSTQNILTYMTKQVSFFKKSKKSNDHAPWYRRSAVATHQVFIIFAKSTIQNPNIQSGVF